MEAINNRLNNELEKRKSGHTSDSGNFKKKIEAEDQIIQTNFAKIDRILEVLDTLSKKQDQKVNEQIQGYIQHLGGLKTSTGLGVSAVLGADTQQALESVTQLRKELEEEVAKASKLFSPDDSQTSRRTLTSKHDSEVAQNKKTNQPKKSRLISDPSQDKKVRKAKPKK